MYAIRSYYGMDFTMLADLVGGGDQTPGLVGINRYYPLSPKFFPAEGGLSRLVWVPKKLKEELREGIIGWCQAMGLPVFFDMIADETKGIAEEDVLAFLRERGHPRITSYNVCYTKLLRSMHLSGYLPDHHQWCGY